MIVHTFKSFKPDPKNFWLISTPALLVGHILRCQVPQSPSGGDLSLGILQQIGQVGHGTSFKDGCLPIIKGSKIWSKFDDQFDTNLATSEFSWLDLVTSIVSWSFHDAVPGRVLGLYAMSCLPTMKIRLYKLYNMRSAGPANRKPFFCRNCVEAAASKFREAKASIYTNLNHSIELQAPSVSQLMSL